MSLSDTVWHSGEDVSKLREQLAAERARADELRRACADVLGQDPETWPDHGNAPLAIAAALALAVTDRDRLKAAIEQAPHARDCASTAFALTPGGPSPLGYSCNCWKRAALEG